MRPDHDRMERRASRRSNESSIKARLCSHRPVAGSDVAQRRGYNRRMTATIETVEAMERPPVSMGSRLEGELLEVSMGPQHPSTHGVFRMNVALEGEIVRKLKPVFGYLHRNHEKIGENASYLASMPYTDRLDYFCSMTNNWAYALSVKNWPASKFPSALSTCESSSQS